MAIGTCQSEYVSVSYIGVEPEDQLKSRMWESCSYGSVRVRAGNCPFYSTIADCEFKILDFAADCLYE